MPPRIVIGITGASGAIYGVRLLEALQPTPVETHVVISKAAHLTLQQEMGLQPGEVQAMADHAYSIQDVGAAIASGSFRSLGMVIAPCSVSTLSEIATGISSSLLTRAADVMLKERRKLVLMVRETPLHTVHTEHMLTLSRMGAIIAPPVPAFYNHPQSLDDIIHHTVGRVLDLFDIEIEGIKRWEGMTKAPGTTK